MNESLVTTVAPGSSPGGTARTTTLCAMGFGTSALVNLEATLRRLGQDAFSFSKLNQADILLFNGDLPECTTIVRRLRQHRKCPIVVVGAPPHEDIPNICFLQHPLAPETLMQTLHRLSAAPDAPDAPVGAETAAADAAAVSVSAAAVDTLVPPIVPAMFSLGASNAGAAPLDSAWENAISPAGAREAAGALERDLGLFDHHGGFFHDVDLNDPLQVRRLCFNPDGYLSEYIRSALLVMGKEATLIDISLEGRRILLDPTGNRWGGDLDEKLLQRLCLGPLRHKPKIRLLPRSGLKGRINAQGRAEIVPGLADFSGEQQPITNHRARRAEFILAQIALWCAHGRLREGTDIHTPLSLKHWPNLPCLPRIQGAMQISALWMLHPCSLAQAVAITGLRQRQVFAFYTVCDALCLFEERGGAADADNEWIDRIRSALNSSQNASQKTAAPKESSSGLPAFLQRLLAKVWK